MGGFNSGRHGGRPTAEACGSLVLSVHGWRPREGATIGYRLTFECDGEDFPVLVILDWTESNRPHARLRHSIRTDDGAEVEYRVALTRSPCRFGGWRWWWICPNSGARVFKLFLPRGGRRFLSRRAYRLGYLSQRLSSLDRAHRAREKAERRLSWTDDGEPCPAPGMRRRAFERFVARWEKAAERLDAEWEPRTLRVVARLMGRSSG